MKWLILLLLGGCMVQDSPDVLKIKEEAEKVTRNLMKGQRIASDIEYIYDERTGLCYAYLWEGASNGGPALTLVPYETVKHLLLNPPKIQSKDKIK